MVGEILNVADVPDSQKLVRLTVDFGTNAIYSLE